MENSDAPPQSRSQPIFVAPGMDEKAPWQSIQGMLSKVFKVAGKGFVRCGAGRSQERHRIMERANVRKQGNAFTLIELLIVVAIIAILAAIAVPNFLEAQTRSKISRCKSDLRSLATAWETYRMDYNRYPPDFDGGEYGGTGGYSGEWRTYIVVTTPIAYISSVPKDIFQQSAPPSTVKKPGMLFEYWGTLNNIRLQAWQQTNTMYLIIGYGPDQDHDLSGANIAAPFNYMYDPTNGTKSNGDIARSNARSYPE